MAASIVEKVSREKVSHAIYAHPYSADDALVVRTLQGLNRPAGQLWEREAERAESAPVLEQSPRWESSIWPIVRDEWKRELASKSPTMEEAIQAGRGPLVFRGWAHPGPFTSSDPEKWYASMHSAASGTVQYGYMLNAPFLQTQINRTIDGE